jgi:hypothetical protein
MRYLLSKLIPVRFISTYGIVNPDRTTYVRSTWWQWRERIWRHDMTPLA